MILLSSENFLCHVWEGIFNIKIKWLLWSDFPHNLGVLFFPISIAQLEDRINQLVSQKEAALLTEW